MADLHLHSNASDGSDPPRRVMQRAKAAGLRAAALTDHDTVDGLAEARVEARRLGLEFVDGIELSSVHEGRLVHILGHFVQPGAPRLCEQISRYRRERKDRMDRMLERLRRVGVALDPEDFYRAHGGAPSIGRGQLSSYLVEKRFVRTREEVFHRFIGEDGPAYVALDMISPAEAVELIVGAGGAATYAHPHLSGADEIIPALVSAGLVGLEVDHPAQDEEARRRYRALATRYGLLCMGGSDCHGARPGPERMGRHNQPLRLVAELRGRRWAAA